MASCNASAAARGAHAQYTIHPISITRFRSFQTQPLESLIAAVKLPIKKRFLGNPTLATSIMRENIVMGTACSII